MDVRHPEITALEAVCQFQVVKAKQLHDRCVGTWYHALVHVPESQDELLPGTVGEAGILVDPQSLLTQFRQWFARAFAFKLRT
jgi:hypothetical protein